MITKCTNLCVVAIEWHATTWLSHYCTWLFLAAKFSGCDCPNAILVKRIYAIKDWVGTSTLETFIRRDPSSYKTACRIDDFSTRLQSPRHCDGHVGTVCVKFNLNSMVYIVTILRERHPCIIVVFVLHRYGIANFLSPI